VRGWGIATDNLKLTTDNYKAKIKNQNYKLK